MEYLFIAYLILFIVGLFFGSFLNLVSDRILSKEGIVFGRSHCDHCNTPLKPKDLIPVFSFLMLKGKCAYCKKKLSWYYPTSELLVGFLFILAAYLSHVLIDPTYVSLAFFVYFIVIFGLYSVMIFTDFKFRIIPNRIVYFGIIFSLLFLVLFFAFSMLDLYFGLKADPLGRYLLQTDYFYNNVWRGFMSLLGTVVSAFLISGFFYLLLLITRGKGMGGGDVKLAFLIGLVNTFPQNIWAIFLGFVLGAVASLLLIAFGKKTMKDTIAFGPFLIAGSILVLFISKVAPQFLGNTALMYLGLY